MASAEAIIFGGWLRPTVYTQVSFNAIYGCANTPIQNLTLVLLRTTCPSPSQGEGCPSGQGEVFPDFWVWKRDFKRVSAYVDTHESGNPFHL